MIVELLNGIGINMKQTNMYNRIIVVLLIIASFAACKKDVDHGIRSGAAQIKIDLVGTEFDFSEVDLSNGSKASSSKSKTSSSGIIQSQIIPFSNEFNITADLMLDNSKQALGGSPSRTVSNTQSRNGSGASKAAIERYPLGDQIKYKIMAYHNGTFVDERIVTHGEESTLAPFLLDGGETYTFLVYSVNSTTSLPEVVGKNSLSTVQLSDVSEDLMWFKKDLQVFKGDNNLSIILKHVFSQITVNISTGAYGGVVDAVEGPVMSTSRVSASLKFSTGQITYATNTATKNVAFGAMNQPLVTSEAVILISPEATDGKLSISGLSINGLKKPLTVEGLQISPGKKYNLNLTVNAPCTKIVYIENFNLTNGASQTFDSIPSTDYGFIFDVYYLDNSLNLIINGEPLLKREFWEETNQGTATNPRWTQTNYTNQGYDFQFVDKHDDVPPLVQNLRFASDKARWGIPGTSSTGNDVDFIYFLKGDVERPIFRIHILQNGQIELLGSRGNYGPLEPLEIFGDKRGPIVNNDFKTKYRYYYKAYLNPAVVWNTTGYNTVKATQVNSGPTNMKGVAYGRSRMDCPQ